MNTLLSFRTKVVAVVASALLPAALLAAEAQVKVYTSILPQSYFVEKIGGDRVDVSVLVSPGKGPATYEPTPRQVLELGSTDILFTIGVPFEKAFIPTIKQTLPGLIIVDTAAGIQRRIMTEPHHHDDEEEHHDEHEHHEDDHDEHEHHNEAHHEDEHDDHHHEEGGEDPHIWLSPRLVKVQAQTIYNALVNADPAGKAVYSQGLKALISELDELDAKLSTTLAPFKGQTLFVYHPSMGYFTDDYGLKQAAIETGGKEPSPSALEHIIEEAKEQNVKIIFVQPEFSQNSARSIAKAIDGAVVTLTPLDPDYINNLTHIAEEIEKAFN